MAILDILNSPNLISCKILDAEIDKLTFLMNPNWFHVKSQNLTWYHTSTEIVILTFLMFWMNQKWFQLKNHNLTWNHTSTEIVILTFLMFWMNQNWFHIKKKSKSYVKSCSPCKKGCTERLNTRLESVKLQKLRRV